MTGAKMYKSQSPKANPTDAELSSKVAANDDESCKLKIMKILIIF